jgi:hypothetical protein
MYIFDIPKKCLTSYVVKPNHTVTIANGQKVPDPIIQIKAHWMKMHRLLFGFADTGASVFSLNKNREIRTVSTANTQAQKGKVVAVEWIGPTCKEFIMGFEKGGLEVYSGEGTSQTPLRKLNFNEQNIKKMKLGFYARPKPEINFLVIEFSKNAEFNPMVTQI